MTTATVANPECFVIMPIADLPGYAPGHFKRVYDNVIAPSCERAGFVPVLASAIQRTNFIVLDILKRLLGAEMAVCDLSGRNPNVFFELGLRQAFNRPVTLLKDELTERAFDIQGIRDNEYSSTLRIDLVTASVADIADTIRNTHASYKSASPDVNSLVQLLGIPEATVKRTTPLSDETALILSELKGINQRLNSLERNSPNTFFMPSSMPLTTSPTSVVYSAPETWNELRSRFIHTDPSGAITFLGSEKPDDKADE